ncbi:NmrA family NAD(P)-binding protein [Mucilaginibacter ginsenosidivorax]|uniref:NAD-dependent epimerase/dehydratase family protein n=1 Tax=Mucilaginibacter ginsenosidivorax TaxID=862126 RepID=A0A5B8W1Q1_9SPHI|nr:NAD(P)H-binding protein [Mucilaginibacter ginsenosidivorax]QEC76766.1 NAD-dependent epimerase/dehydratase family protein [Mucilaginibacter ginsenosidivorax]
MKIIITGSLGNISKPLTEKLVHNGHQVTVISTRPERQAEIENIGAQAAIGSMEDVDFLTATFATADAVYCMESLAPNAFFDKDLDVSAAIIQICKNYQKAIQESGVKKVIHLSSIGAHTDKGVGLLAFHYQAEQIFNELDDDVSIKFMRPVGFYYNMLAFIPTIKAQGTIVSNYGGDNKEPWVSPLDIASVIAQEFEKPFEGRTVRYIASDEVAPNEVAAVLGQAVGKPDLQWTAIPDEAFLNRLVSFGMNPQTARGFTEMNAARLNGILYEDYYKHRPELGPHKLNDYAKEFAAIYHQQ